MEKDQIIELRIDDMLDDGRAFGRHEGCAVFAAASGLGSDPAGSFGSVVPGDVIRAQVIKSKKNSAEAVATEMVEPSPDRIEAECPYFGECGGCALQELSYEAQKRLKSEQVRAKLKRLGGLEDPKVNEIIAADTLKYYRNKAVFAVGPHGEVGFKKAKSNFVLDIEDCLLQSDAAMVCADALRAFLREHTGAAAQIDQLTVKTAFGTGEVMAVLDVADPAKMNNGSKGKKKTNQKTDKPGIDNYFGIRGIEELVGMFDDAVRSINVDEEDAEGGDFEYSLESVALIHKGKCHIIAGKPTITDEVITVAGSTISYEISPQSFYQVNPGQMAKLYDKAAEYAFDSVCGAGPGCEAEDLTILDLYCGAGTIGIWLLDRLRNTDAEVFEKAKVIGIESVKPAIIDANRNSVINGLINTRYICGRAEEELPGMMGLTKLYKWNETNERVEREPDVLIGKAAADDANSSGSANGNMQKVHITDIDAVILDPPRAGCGEALLAAVAAAQPDRIVYVSCDPGTLARDIKYLCANGYEFIEATPVDQFPWTTSIEVCSLLIKSAEPLE